MDDARIALAKGELGKTIGIGPVIRIILSYAKQTEAELVFIALMEHEDHSVFDIGRTYVNDPGPDPYGEEYCWINKNFPTKEIAEAEGEKNWTPESRYEFRIAFGSCWDVFDTTVKVTIDDLVPSRGLKIAGLPKYENDILYLCRNQYIERMSARIKEI